MAGHNYLEPDSELDCLQFLARDEMQPLFSVNLFGNWFMDDNLFVNWLMDDNSSTSLLGLPQNLPEETIHTHGSDIFAATDDANASFAGDLRQCSAAGENGPQQSQSAKTSRSNGDLTGVEPGTCVSSEFSLERAVECSSIAMENCQSALSSTETIMSGNRKEIAFGSAITGIDNNYSLLQKRKTVQKAVYTKAAKGKRWNGMDNVKDAVEVSEPKAEQSITENTEENCLKATPAPLEQLNYIHVRARRGEATDRHSLAERARRNKITERMRFLQDLVPGCRNIKGKALILEEIIKHIQSLHRQVEILSMKAASVNPQSDYNNHRICGRDITTCGPPNGGISADSMSSPYLPCEQTDESNVNGWKL